ncbi:hypothetical protein BGW36DRAFT_357859 [Talaromyces proteolyticus]|uniref:Large ribosomal subunit protein mL50 n=1 Tax=Talaromyces proteolyticus TaxID=1131652 RepID=A0AAD4KT37_9EURO|nr:uncharacterized protein BGW36DRAFT_357859 [Talaromyces proteolyticus]KAH8698320.1 hypothetical protein BGW36DRAFT_357859 [Talaromyces proteolyticus]
MRPPVRLLQPLEAPSLQFSKTLYVCSNCRYEVIPSCSAGHQQARRNASGNTPFTEKLRRRIWGTDNPPGLKDPYGGEGMIARTWKQRKEEYLGRKEEEEIPEEEEEYKFPTIPDDDQKRPDFVPATHAHNLKKLGHLSFWKNFPPSDADAYYPFLARRKIRTKEHVRSAAHSVAVELCILHDLKKPLDVACDAAQHHQSVWAIIRRCQIKENAQSLDDALIYPSEESKKLLHFVFNQLGPQPENKVESNEEVELNSEAIKAELKTPKFYEPDTQSRAAKISFEPRDKGYLTLPLNKRSVKFAYLKRLAQITGYPVPDTRANKAQNVKHVTDYLEKVICPPKKLAEELSSLPSRRGIPNLTVKYKRYTKRDHDRDTGRQQLIDEALRERGLLYEQDETTRFRL